MREDAREKPLVLGDNKPSSLRVEYMRLSGAIVLVELLKLLEICSEEK